MGVQKYDCVVDMRLVGKHCCAYCWFYSQRYITVLMFLNEPEDGGNTAFPVADNTTYSDEVMIQRATTQLLFFLFRLFLKTVG